VNVAKLIEDSERLREELEKLGPERMAELEAGLIPRISMLEKQ
jgi:hypothetical protein